MAKEENETGIREKLSKIKTPLYIAATALGALGIIGTIILLFVSFHIIANIEIPAVTQIDDTAQSVEKIDAAMNTVEDQMLALNNSFGHIDSSITDMKTGLKNTGEAIRDFGSGLNEISVGPFALLTQYGDKIKNAGTSLVSASDTLAQLSASVKKQQTGILEFRDKLENLRNKVQQQKTDIVTAGDNIKQVFSTLKLAILLFCFLHIFLYLAIISLGIGGLAK